MNKFLLKQAIKAKNAAEHLQSKAKQFLNEKAGGGRHTDEFLWIALGVVIIIVIIAWVIPFFKEKLAPKIGDSLLGIFDNAK